MQGTDQSVDRSCSGRTSPRVCLMPDNSPIVDAYYDSASNFVSDRGETDFGT